MFHDKSQIDADWQAIYKLATSFIQPRPIALVSTVSKAGVRNLAPFSFYNMVSANPPVVVFAPSYQRDGAAKDSLRNVEETGEFVVATVTEALAERMNQCAFAYPSEVDEFEASGLTARPARRVQPACVVESPVNIECELLEIKKFGDAPGAGCAIFGRIVALHVDDIVLADDGLVDPVKLRAIGRMGRQTYAKTTQTFDLPRPTQR